MSQLPLRPAFLAGAFLFAALASSPLPAAAGFQWVTPVESGEAVDAPSSLRPELSPVPRPLDLSPTIIESAPIIEPPVRLTPPSVPSLTPPSRPTALTPVPLAAPVIGVEPAVVSGFADRVPLTLALRQVLPAGTGFKFADGVDPTQTVSWRGGQAWQGVLSSMLSSVGLQYRQDGNLIEVARASIAAPISSGASGGASGALPSFPLPPPLPSSPTPSAQNRGAPDFGGLAPESGFVSSAPAALTGTIPNADIDARLGPQSWSVEAGTMLRETLEAWCRRAGVELYWSSEYDFPIRASATLTGSFEEAVRDLLTGFEGARPQPFGRLHVNPAAGQTLLIISVRGNDYGE